MSSHITSSIYNEETKSNNCSINFFRIVLTRTDIYCNIYSTNTYCNIYGGENGRIICVSCKTE